MAEVLLYGANDDLAEIERDIRAEFQADCYKRGRFIFDTGTQIELYMNHNGSWQLNNVTPDDVVNDDVVYFGDRPNRPSGSYDMACKVMGDFKEIVWVMDYQIARISE